MPASNVDLVLVVESSDSMRNCFDQLRQHLGSFLAPYIGEEQQLCSAGLLNLSTRSHRECRNFCVRKCHAMEYKMVAT